MRRTISWRNRWLVLVVACVGATGIAVIDYFVGREISLAIFYMIPIVLVGWSLSRSDALFVACYCSLLWYSADRFAGPDYHYAFAGYWNAAVRWVFFTSIALLVHYWRQIQTRDQLRQFAAHLQEAREEERTRIAREIHDKLGQSLTALKMDVWAVEHAEEHAAPTDEKMSRLQRMERSIDQMLGHVRKIATELRPSILDQLGLAAALEWQTRDMAERTGLDCRYHGTRTTVPLSAEQSTAVFRIFQEALTNVVRHAHATRIAVAVAQHEDRWTLEVCDNGQGIRMADLHAPQSLGILGMRERTALLGGTLEFDGQSGCGTTVRLSLPISASQENSHGQHSDCG